MIRLAALFQRNRYTFQFKEGQLPLPDSAVVKKANMKIGIILCVREESIWRNDRILSG